MVKETQHLFEFAFGSRSAAWTAQESSNSNPALARNRSCYRINAQQLFRDKGYCYLSCSWPQTALGLSIQLKNNLTLASCPLLAIRAGWFYTRNFFENQLLQPGPGTLLPIFSSSSSSKNSGKENASLSCSISSFSVSNSSPWRAFRTDFTWLGVAQPKREL